MKTLRSTERPAEAVEEVTGELTPRVWMTSTMCQPESPWSPRAEVRAREDGMVELKLLNYFLEPVGGPVYFTQEAFRLFLRMAQAEGRPIS